MKSKYEAHITKDLLFQNVGLTYEIIPDHDTNM